jgi:hypothetical protein
MWFWNSNRHGRLHRRLSYLTRLMEALMVDFSKVKDEQARLVAEVTALRSVTAGVGVVVLSQASKLHDLADQIAQLTAGAVSQEDIDALAASTHDLADSVAAGKDEVTAAVKAGTPVESEAAVVEPVVPAPVA